MKKEQCKIALVSHSRAVAQTLQTLATAMELKVEIHFAAMERAISVAKDCYAKGADVILACGSTGAMLDKKLDMPVFYIRNSHLDYLCALLKAKEYASTVAMPFFEEVPEGLGVLAEVLHIRVVPFIFIDTPNIIQCISQCVDQKINCVIGSNIVTEMAKAQGCIGIETPYSDHEIQRSLYEAVAMVKMNDRNNLNRIFLEKIAEIQGNGIIGVDDDGEILVWNSQATSLLDCNRHERNAQKYLRALGTLSALKREVKQNVLAKNLANVPLYASSMPVNVEETVYGALTVFQNQPETPYTVQKRYSGFKSRYSLQDIVGKAPCIKALRSQAKLYAQTDATILISGETGTGKELLAHAIHNASSRRNAPFVALNCAALTESLLESELFGYAEGSFTGAKRGGKDGIFVMAQGGTVFLDEIADISHAVQVRLLRVLENREVMRVGGDRIIPVDVRVICSTWKNLITEVHAGRFRADLYYRLCVLSLILPPLRDRCSDIPMLISNFYNKKNINNKPISEYGIKLLSNYSWPGNIRELDTFLQRYTLLIQHDAPDDKLLESIIEDMKIFSHIINTETSHSKIYEKIEENGQLINKSLKYQLQFYEQSIIKKSLEKNKNNRLKTAKELHVSPNTLWRKMKLLENPTNIDLLR